MMNPAASTAVPAGYTRELVEFLHGIEAAALPGEVLDRARYFLVDYLAVAIRGSQEESARCVQRMIERMVAPGFPTKSYATVIGTSIRTLPALAALANGTASHGIEQ